MHKDVVNASVGSPAAKNIRPNQTGWHGWRGESCQSDWTRIVGLGFRGFRMIGDQFHGSGWGMRLYPYIMSILAIVRSRLKHVSTAQAYQVYYGLEASSRAEWQMSESFDTSTEYQTGDCINGLCFALTCGRLHQLALANIILIYDDIGKSELVSAPRLSRQQEIVGYDG